MNTIKLNSIGDSPVVVKKGSQVQGQEKTVEITENGTTEVVPDSGFSLSKVTVNTNVESSGSSMDYLDVSEANIDVRLTLVSMSFIAKVPNTIEISVPNENSVVTIEQGVYPSANVTPSIFSFANNAGAAFSTAIKAVSAVGIDTQVEIYMSGQKMTLSQILIMQGIEQIVATLPRITKEEFYAL